MKTTVAAGVVGVLAMSQSASAFVTPSGLSVTRTATKASSSSALKMAYFDVAPGVSSPFGFFDPLGLSKDLDDKAMKKYAEAEIKHGRVAMAAFLGMIVQEVFHPFDSDAGGPAVFQFQEVEVTAPYLALLLTAGIALTESLTIKKGWSMTEKETAVPVAALNSEYTPGDLGFDPLRLLPSDSNGAITMKTKELNNGRLAMIAVLGVWMQELVEGKGVLEHIFDPIIGKF